VLDGRRVNRRADCGEHRLPGCALGAHDPDLDELVRAQRAVDLGDERRGESGSADQNDRVQPVRAALERLSLSGRQLFRHLRFAPSPRL
jgi:hypothetical protein